VIVEVTAYRIVCDRCSREIPGAHPFTRVSLICGMNGWQTNGVSVLCDACRGEPSKKGKVRK